jgi:hypothetical protein
MAMQVFYYQTVLFSLQYTKMNINSAALSLLFSRSWRHVRLIRRLNQLFRLRATAIKNMFDGRCRYLRHPSHNASTANLALRQL